MIKRSKFLTALICIILSVISVFGIVFSGCAEYKPPEDNGDNPPVIDDPDDPDDPDNPVDEYANDFTVQLVIKPSSSSGWQNFTYDYYEASDGKDGVHEQGWIKWETIRVQWTNVETGARHYSNLNEEGKAACAGLDGDYKVTLTSIPTGFTYEPNINYTDNITKKIEVVIYKIQGKGASVKMLAQDKDGNKRSATATKLPSTGVFRTTLTSKDDKVMFYFQPSKQGTYSMTTLVDITENKINPKITLFLGQVASGAIYFNMEQDGGGSENTYTKNVRLEYNISADMVGNALFFELHSTSLDGNASYPITVDFLIERNGDFTRTDLSTTVQVTEDFTKTPEQPEGTFTWAYDNSVTLDKTVSYTKVILNTETGRLASYLQSGAEVEMGEQATLNDGYYYFFTYDGATNTYTLTDRLYAVVNEPNDVFDFSNTQLWSVRYLLDSRDPTKAYNYTEFLSIYQEHCNSDGAYPVNEELAEFLQHFCVQNRLFNDGNGTAEGLGYNSDEKGMWLISCAYYRQ